MFYNSFFKNNYKFIYLFSHRYFLLVFISKVLLTIYSETRSELKYFMYFILPFLAIFLLKLSSDDILISFSDKSLTDL